MSHEYEHLLSRSPTQCKNNGFVGIARCASFLAMTHHCCNMKAPLHTHDYVMSVSSTLDCSFSAYTHAHKGMPKLLFQPEPAKRKSQPKRTPPPPPHFRHVRRSQAFGQFQSLAAAADSPARASTEQPFCSMPDKITRPQHLTAGGSEPRISVVNGCGTK